jgi:N-acetyl-gamma-glutamyl-phosphate reductase
MDNLPLSIGILGAGGYSGREAVRILSAHPHMRIAFATSESEAGTPLSRFARGADAGTVLMRAENAPLGECDAVLLCLPHGESMKWAERALNAGAAVVDLSSDLRVRTPQTPAWAREAVYGLPELHRDRIAATRLVANPGCYPTAALLALAPLIEEDLIDGPVIIDAASGVTGAGRSHKKDLLFGEVAEDFRAYAAGNVHRHLAEMRDQAVMLGGGATPELVFTPHLLPVKRGILETIYVPLRERIESPFRLWENAFAGEPFVEVLDDRMPSLADVVGSNRVSIGSTLVDGVSRPMLLVVAAIDNLVKGAAGQAVQNLNLMFGLDETEGLT